MTILASMLMLSLVVMGNVCKGEMVGWQAVHGPGSKRCSEDNALMTANLEMEECEAACRDNPCCGYFSWCGQCRGENSQDCKEATGKDWVKCKHHCVLTTGCAVDTEDDETWYVATKEYDTPVSNQQCPAGVGGRRLGKAKAAKQLGKWLLNAVASAIIGKGVEELIDGWIGEGDAVNTESKFCSDVCRPYPTSEKAPFCNFHSHDHRIHCSVDGEAELRDREAKVLWQKMELDPDMGPVLSSSVICYDTFKDSFCLDAFPHCHCNDKTACNIVCRNMNTCLRDQKKSTVIDCEVACATESCAMQTMNCDSDGMPAHCPSKGQVLWPSALMTMIMLWACFFEGPGFFLFI